MNKLKSLTLLASLATLAACNKKEETIVIETHPDKTLGERMHEAGDTVSYAAHRAGNSASDAYHATKDRAGEAYDATKSKASDVYHATKDKAKETAQNAKKAIHNATK